MSAKAKQDREYLTVSRVAAEVGVTQKTVRNWIKAKRLAAKRVGGVIRIMRSDLERAIKPQL